ncbi:unnamed protein product, partial [Notodromas monacha]
TIYSTAQTSGLPVGYAKEPPSRKLNHKISCMRLEHEIGDLRKRLENMRLRLDAEIRIKDQAELEVREIRNEISDKKRMLNEILAAMKRAGASESHILLLPSSSLATPSNGPKMNGHKSANHHQYVLEMTSRIDSNWRHGKRRTIPSKSLSNLAIAEKKLELRYLRDERRLAELRKNELIKSITTMQDQLNRRRTELNHKISCMRLEHEIGDLRKRLENMRLRLDAEIRIKDQAELEVREIRNEISDKKRMLNEILAAMKRAGASESHILLLPSSSLATPSNGPKMNGHKSANHHQYVLEMTSRIDSNWRHGKRRTIPSKSLSNLASLPSDA